VRGQFVGLDGHDSGSFTGLPDGYRLDVAGVSNWATFQIKRDPARLVTLAGAVALLVGLVLSLSVRRRRLWVRATPQDDGFTLVEVAGLGRADGTAFRDEFPRLVGLVAAVAPPEVAPPARPEPQPSEV
jgi:cytochrome c biogenesis protein